jgi:hypothetical protein
MMAKQSKKGNQNTLWASNVFFFLFFCIQHLLTSCSSSISFIHPHPHLSNLLSPPHHFNLWMLWTLTKNNVPSHFRSFSFRAVVKSADAIRHYLIFSILTITTSVNHPQSHLHLVMFMSNSPSNFRPSIPLDTSTIQIPNNPLLLHSTNQLTASEALAYGILTFHIIVSCSWGPVGLQSVDLLNIKWQSQNYNKVETWIF